ncbi:hypothetical protein MKK58_04515 [Methylobacterium sp. J-078]|uniref:hypothetical protein n=1 Tax=Methylobacterium sp. J-078 TaxID=2836657 RepID=UPI001FBBB111|nr:hypothetical protein [Methylobacterium sp. J-078]MCJ2043800.1 hypothetical protein [Methylobacterium sp. J-078]
MKITDYEAGSEDLWGVLKDTKFASVRRANVSTGEHPVLGKIIIIAGIDCQTQVIEAKFNPAIGASEDLSAIKFAMYSEPPPINEQTTGAFFR